MRGTKFYVNFHIVLLEILFKKLQQYSIRGPSFGILELYVEYTRKNNEGFNNMVFNKGWLYHANKKHKNA